MCQGWGPVWLQQSVVEKTQKVFYNTFKQKGAVVYFNVQHFKSAK